MTLLPKPRRSHHPSGLIGDTIFLEEIANYWKARAEFAEAELESVLENITYESEYDGRMYTSCIGCSFDDDKQEHKKNCKFVKAVEAIAELKANAGDGS